LVTLAGAIHEYVPGVRNAVLQLEKGVTLFEAALAGPVPITLVAVTVNVYAVPIVKPVTVIVPEPAWLNVPVSPPGDDVAV
jgi:hypothetical protein